MLDKKRSLQEEQEFQAESAKLKATQAWLEEEIHKFKAYIERLKERDLDIKSAAWEERLDLKDSANLADNALAQSYLRQNFGEQEAAKKRIVEYKRIKDKPYFGKINFRYDDDPQAEAYYLGLRGIYDDEALESLVIDWRSPLASLYYEDDLGPVTVEGPRGPLNGELLSKQIISIHRGELLAVEDYQEGSSDAILENLLARPTDSAMRDIVASIQKQQNQIIRYPANESFLLLGAAGSGKTSIALHRAAWILYQKRFEAKQILFLSPTRVFGEYVMSVLPTLGEDSLTLATLQELQIQQVEKIDSRFSKFDFEEAPSSRLDPAAGADFLELVDCYITNQVYPSLTQQPNFAEAVDLVQIYRDFLSSPAIRNFAPDLFERRIARRYDRLDLAILGRMAQLLDPSISSNPYYHILIDEAQDLLVLEHAFLHTAFPSPTNLFADKSQAIRFVLPEDYTESVCQIYSLPDENVFKLNRTYRSSYEIMDFAKNIIGDKNIIPFDRHSYEVSVERVDSVQDQLVKIPSILAGFYARGGRRMAIITRSEEERQGLMYALETWTQDKDIVLEKTRARMDYLSFPWPQLLGQGQDPDQGLLEVYVVTANMAKGLEFDAVLISDASKDNYASKREQRLLYVAATRALHELHILYIKEPSPFLG